jgi:hypothetical protein
MKAPLKVDIVITDANGKEKARYTYSDLSEADVVQMEKATGDALQALALSKVK